MEITISVQLTLKDQWFFSASSQASWCYLQEFCCGLINRVTWSQTDRSLPILLLSATRSPNSVKSPWKPLRNVLAYFQKNIKHILKKKEKKRKKYFKKALVGEMLHCKKISLATYGKFTRIVPLSRVCVSWACSLRECICLWMLTVIFVVLFEQRNSVKIPFFGLSKGQLNCDGWISSFRTSIQTVIIGAE